MKLTDDQRQILGEMANLRKYPADNPWACANWIAEGCRHHYDTPWASARLPGLAKRGLIERGDRGWWKITAAGRAALSAKEGE